MPFLSFFTDSDDASAPYDVVLFDVDSKDSTVGMTCPPRAFVDEQLIAKVKHSLLKPEGMYPVVFIRTCTVTFFPSEKKPLTAI